MTRLGRRVTHLRALMDDGAGTPATAQNAHDRAHQDPFVLYRAALRAGPLGASAADIMVGNTALNPAADLFEMRRVTVGSGTVEIQRNIIAKRVLGLPS